MFKLMLMLQKSRIFKTSSRMCQLKYSMTILCAFSWTITSCLSQSNTTQQPTADILWSLAPCQSAFSVPNTTDKFSPNSVTYVYEGNPLSTKGQCFFTFESNLDSRIVLNIQQLQLFGSEGMVPQPCVSIFDVIFDGSIVLLQKLCEQIVYGSSTTSVFTRSNIGIVSSTIRYGSFKLEVRSVNSHFNGPDMMISTASSTSSTPSTSTSTIIHEETTAPITTSESENSLIMTTTATGITKPHELFWKL